MRERAKEWTQWSEGESKKAKERERGEEGAVLMYVPGSLKKQIYCLRDHNVLTLIEY